MIDPKVKRHLELLDMNVYLWIWILPVALKIININFGFTFLGASLLHVPCSMYSLSMSVILGCLNGLSKARKIQATSHTADAPPFRGTSSRLNWFTSQLLWFNFTQDSPWIFYEQVNCQGMILERAMCEFKCSPYIHIQNLLVILRTENSGWNLKKFVSTIIKLSADQSEVSAFPAGWLRVWRIGGNWFIKINRIMISISILIKNDFLYM